MSNIQDQFNANGYYIAKNALSTKECDEMNDDIKEMAGGKYPSPLFNDTQNKGSAEEIYNKILCVHQPHSVSPIFVKHTKHPNITEVLGQCVGPSVKCMQSMYFVKPP